MKINAVTSAIAIVCALLYVFPAFAEDLNSDDVAAGKEIATTICINCHIVMPGQSPAPLFQPPAPNFIIMAKRSRLSDKQLRAFLSSPHHSAPTMRKMPDVPLADSQIDKLVVYFKSLK